MSIVNAMKGVLVETRSKLTAVVVLGYPDNSTKVLSVSEGDEVTNLVHMINGVKQKIDIGRVRTIGYETISNEKDSDNCTHNNSNSAIKLTNLIIDCSKDYKSDLRIVSIDSIVDFDSDEILTTDTILSEDDNLVQAIADMVSGDVVRLPVVEISETLTIPDGVTIKGVYYGKEREDYTLEGETVYSGALTLTDKVVTLDGIALTSDALPRVNGDSSVTLNNCLIQELTCTANKNYGVMTSSDSTTQLVVDSCVFGDNDTTMYNLFELQGALEDGTTIRNCYFTESSCNHNSINIYDVEDGATITIENNIWECSKNAIRIGIKGDKACTINIKGNTYNSTDSENPDYAGLVLIQPYSKVTTSMRNVVINIDDTNNLSGIPQLFYYFANSSDTQLTGDDLPKVYVNGVLQNLE